MLKDWKRRRQLGKVRPGDGSPLKKFRFYHAATRTQFSLNRADSHGNTHEYSVVVRYFADTIDVAEESQSSSKKVPAAPISVYRNGRQLFRANSPATFEVPGGFIEVGTSFYGLTRMHFVGSDGTERALTPHPHSMEGWRARFGSRYPRSSKAIGVVAILVLLVGLVVGIPQAIEIISGMDVIADNFGSFTSPIVLPGWAETTLLLASIIAAMERALTLRNHWLIDHDTNWTSFF